MSMFVFICVCVRKCLHLQAYVCDERGKIIYKLKNK